MTVIQMSQRELSRLRIMVELEDGRLTVAAAASLMGIGQRQVFRLRQAFAAAGPSGLASRKRGRPSNHRHGATLRRTVLTLVREQYADFGPTLASEKLAERGVQAGAQHQAAFPRRALRCGQVVVRHVRSRPGRWRLNPPRACVCRWAPDTETKIPAEPTPERLLTGPGDEVPDAPGSPAGSI